MLKEIGEAAAWAAIWWIIWTALDVVFYRYFYKEDN